MPLVNYDSESDSEDQIQEVDGHGLIAGGPEQAKLLPPLPASFYNIYTAGPKLPNDPELHEGRQRVVKHMDGKWPSHIYFELLPRADNELKAFQHMLDYAISQDASGLLSKCVSLLQSELNVQKPLHISLSETLMIPTQQISHFVQRMQSIVNKAMIPITSKDHHDINGNDLDASIECNLSRQLEVFTNPLQTRAFLTVSINPSHKVCVLLYT